MKFLIAMVALGAIATSGAAWAADEAQGRPALQLAGDEAKPAADNSGKNVRDRDSRTLTPMDQGGSEADRTITQEIRKLVVADDELSTNAKNVKIITVDGVVTLRGPVKSTAEKTKIASVSAKAAGVKRVENELEVEAQH
jgi:hyperosmotically inducible protein